MNGILRITVRVLCAAGILIVASNANAQMKVGDKPYSIHKSKVVILK